MSVRFFCIIIVFFLWGNSAYTLFGQIAISPKLSAKINIENILKSDTLTHSDTALIFNYYQPIIAINNTINKTIYQALVANALAQYYDEINPATSEWFTTSINTAEQTGNRAIELWAKMNYVEHLYHFRQISLLPPVLLDVIELTQKIPSNQIINPCNTYIKLGWIMQTFNDDEESYKYLTKALKFTNECPKSEACILNSIGHYYLNKDSITLAAKYFDETYQKACAINDYSRMAKALGDQGRLQFQQGNISGAITLIREDLRYSNIANDSKNTMFASILLAKYELANNNKLAAKQALEAAEKIARSKKYYNVSELEIVKLKLELIEPNQIEEELQLRRQLEELEEKIQLTDGEKNIVRTNWFFQKQKFESKLEFQLENNKKQSLRFSIITSLIVILLVVLIILFFKYNKKQKKKNIQLQESERVRIASDLHDNIINKLTIIRLKSAMQFDPEEIDHLLEDAIGDSRRMSHNLLPPSLDDHLLEQLIEDQALQWNSSFEVDYHYENNFNIRFDSQIKLHIIRIIQEVIHNTYKHSRANLISINLKIEERSMLLQIKDNGIGFDIGKINKGIGLQNIAARAKFIGATYNMESRIDNGTLFTLLYHY